MNLSKPFDEKTWIFIVTCMTFAGACSFCLLTCNDKYFGHKEKESLRKDTAFFLLKSLFNQGDVNIPLTNKQGKFDFRREDSKIKLKYQLFWYDFCFLVPGNMLSFLHL